MKNIVIIGMGHVGMLEHCQDNFKVNNIILVEKELPRGITLTYHKTLEIPKIKLTLDDIDNLHHAPKQKMYNKALNNHNKKIYKK